MIIEIPCTECAGRGYFEYDIGGGNYRKEYCEECKGKGYLLIDMDEEEVIKDLKRS